MDELRNEIWDLLYRTGGPMAVADIAQQVQRDEAQIQEAINHDWFKTDQDQVTIAY